MSKKSYFRSVQPSGKITLPKAWCERLANPKNVIVEDDGKASLVVRILPDKWREK